MGSAIATVAFSLPYTGLGSVTFDAKSNSGTQASATFSWTHSPAEVPELVVVGLGIHPGANRATTVTYGGQAMAFLRHATSAETRAELWYLASPPSGAQTVAMSLLEMPTQAQAGAISFTGVDTATPFGDFGALTGLGTTPSRLLTTVGVDDMVVDMVAAVEPTTLTADAAQVERWKNVDSKLGIGQSTARGSGGSVNMSWSNPAGTRWVIVGAEVNAYPGPSGHPAVFVVPFLVVPGAIVAGLFASRGARRAPAGTLILVAMAVVLAALLGSLTKWEGNPRLELLPFFAIFVTLLLTVPWALLTWFLVSGRGNGVRAGGASGVIGFLALVSVLGPGLVREETGRLLIYLAWINFEIVLGLALVFGALGGRLAGVITRGKVARPAGPE